MKKVETKNCPQCKISFKKPDRYSPARWKQRVHCSTLCQKKSITKKREIECSMCHKKYMVHNFRMSMYKKHFCSRFCKNKDAHSKELYKKNPKPFTVGSTSKEKNSNWKGGITPIYSQIRNSLYYNDWRLKVYIRDFFTCQECGKSGVRLNADHIKPFALILKENNIRNYLQAMKCKELWNIKNGRTLCVPCHRKTPTFGRRP